jgi:hypothetical protein
LISAPFFCAFFSAAAAEADHNSNDRPVDRSHPHHSDVIIHGREGRRWVWTIDVDVVDAPSTVTLAGGRPSRYSQARVECRNRTLRSADAIRCDRLV